jgi:hypothetical protein
MDERETGFPQAAAASTAFTQLQGHALPQELLHLALFFAGLIVAMATFGGGFLLGRNDKPIIDPVPIKAAPASSAPAVAPCRCGRPGFKGELPSRPSGELPTTSAVHWKQNESAKWTRIYAMDGEYVCVIPDVNNPRFEWRRRDPED